MNKVLKNLYQDKSNYRRHQLAFYAWTKKVYPTLIDFNITEKIAELETELKYLLASAVKFKTGKIGIANGKETSPWHSDIGYTKVYIEQKPMIRSFHGSSDDVTFLEECTFLDKNDDLLEKEDEKSSNTKLIAALSELRNEKKKIDQIRLDIFFKYLREIMAYKKKLLVYNSYGNRYSHLVYSFDKNNKSDEKLDKNQDVFSLTASGNLLFVFQPKSFTISRRSNSRIDSYLCTTSLSDILNYSNDENLFDKDLHKLLKVFKDNFNEAKAVLDSAEIEKKKCANVIESFLNSMRQYTTSFKVIKKLT